MKRTHLFILGLLLSSSAAFSQPVWSPEQRAETATAWMRDSLGATEAQVVKIKRIELNYQKQIDMVADKKSKAAKNLMRKKDKDMKGVLNKSQYQRYYRREEQIREAQMNRKEDPQHMPL